MRIGFLVNDVDTEEAEFSTTRLALAAAERGWETWYLGIGDFTCMPGDAMHALARPAPPAPELEGFLDAVVKAESMPLDAESLDVLLLRNDPSIDSDRPWAQSVGPVFGELLTRRGVVVLNDPVGLGRALNKLHFHQFHQFPAQLRPPTLVTRDADAIRRFIDARQGWAILKPLVGAGGKSVFLVQPEETVNVSQMIEAVARDGYVVAQAYIPEVKEGDLRLLVVNGRLLEVGGRYAAFRRVPPRGDVVSNLQAGGEAHPAEVGAHELGVVDAVRPKLVEDGVFLAALDLVGGYLTEVNVFSPAGLGKSSELTGVDFVGAVLDAVEEKVETARRRHVPNVTLATLSADFPARPRSALG